jgi:hypothetical protein
VQADTTSMRKLLFPIVTALLLTACAPSYDATLLASIEGRWMCDVQRYTFETQQDIQAELDARLEGNGVSPEQYHAFKDDLTKKQDLRDQVRAVYDQQCGV